MKTATHGTDEDRGDLRKKRSHFRGAKSFAGPPQLVRTGWWTCSFSKCVSCFPLQALKPSLHVVVVSCQTVTCLREIAIYHQITPPLCFVCVRIRSRHAARAGVSSISWAHLRDQLWDWSHRKFWKKLDTASRFWEFLFLFTRPAAKCKQKGRWGQIRTGIRVRQTPKVWRVRSSFGRGVRTYDGAEMRNNRQTEPKLKRHGPTRVQVLMHKCISHVRPLSEKLSFFTRVPNSSHTLNWWIME